MRAFVFDTETTGLIKNSVVRLELQPRIIELYGCVVEDDGRISEEIEFLCNPGIPIPPIITKITGLCDADLVNRCRWAEAGAIEFLAILKDVDAVVAHNLSFDMAMVNFELRRCGASEDVWPNRRICTVEATEWYQGHRLSLAKLHEDLFGKPFEGSHRARGDVAALTRCFLELRRRKDV